MPKPTKSTRERNMVPELKIIELEPAVDSELLESESEDPESEDPESDDSSDSSSEVGVASEDLRTRVVTKLTVSGAAGP